MAFETNKFDVVRKKRLGKSTFSVQCNVESGVEIDKILSVCHSASADNAEILNGAINYTGSIDLCVLYLTVDGEVGTLSSSCPFTSKFEDEAICVGDKVGIRVEVEDYEIESVSSSVIKINCVCEQSGILICSREVCTINTGDEDVCMKEDDMFVSTLVGQAKDSFVVESGFSIKEPIKKVLFANSQVNVKNAESGVNFVSVSGEVVTRLLYLTETDRFESTYATESFKQEVELEGVMRDAVSEATACVKKCAVKFEVESDEKGVEVKVTTPVEVRVSSYMQMGQKVIKDIYSTSCELQVSTSSFEMTKELSCDHFEQKIDGTLALDEEKPRVDKIMFVGGSNLLLTNAYVKDGEITVEGVAKTNVVYLNDETNSLHSVVIEVPFVVSDKASEEGDVDVQVTLTDVDVVVKKGREFFFDAKLKVCAQYDSDEVGAVISSVEKMSEYDERDCAMELVFAQAGQSAWDIAKQLRVREENIMLQNPELAFPLESDESVVVYYQKR